MATQSKIIKLLLIDGIVTGRIKATLANWTGVVYKIPRTEVEKSKDRDDLTKSGVYFLFGTSDETDKDVVYIGQAGARKNGEGILNRLQEHKRNPNKDYWMEAIVFITSNNSFGPTEISYLENRFCEIAKKINRYNVQNGNEPTLGNITEEKKCELEEFIEYAKIIMGTLGHKIFEDLTQQYIDTSSSEKISAYDERLLYLKRKSNKSGFTIEAQCKQTKEGFVVLRGSHIETIDSNSIPPGIKAIRKTANIDKDGILQEDMLFKSPSSAAAFVIGGHTNGLIDWKIADGKTLKEIETTE